MESNPHIAQEIRRLEEQYAFRPDSLVFGRLADLHRKAGNPDRALDILEEGLQRHPRYLSAHIVRARCLRALDRHDEARDAFREVLELDGQNLVALRSLAEMALERGEPEEAGRHLRTLLQADPHHDEARRMLAEAEAELRSTAEASPDDSEPPEAGRAGEDEREGGARPSGDRPSHPSAAATEEEVEELREQVEELDLGEPAAADDDGEMATRTLAGLYETQGFYREAVEMYERLLEERPGSEAEEIRERLERARAALSESGGRGSTPTSDGADPGAPGPTTASGEGAGSAPEPTRPSDGTDEARAEPTKSVPDARTHLRALLRGEASREDRREPAPERPRPEGAGAQW